MCRCKRSKTGRNFFSGDICHLAVYLLVLPIDTVRAHHFAGVQATAIESDRLYALAGAKFQAALAFAPDDIEIISRYAQSVINYLELESVQVGKGARSTTEPCLFFICPHVGQEAVCLYFLSNLNTSRHPWCDLSWLWRFSEQKSEAKSTYGGRSSGDVRSDGKLGWTCGNIYPASFRWVEGFAYFRIVV